ncbi:DUF4395 domain-containing protein [Thalassobacillus pellis]|uniref:DUF4395 domain-containing protein n=1 Tax=Thalassobacillus pellis TaxID=748008 RepID=UPI0030843D3A|nr:hypothetical protein [Thalassobacillus pellis]
MEITSSIPRPLVRLNQWTIIITVLLTWLTAWHYFLLIPLISGISGLLFGFHPIMAIGRRFLRKPPRSYIPEDLEDQQFNQIIATFCLTMAYLAYTGEWAIIGYIFSAVVFVAAIVAICGFCIGCFIRYQWKRYQHKRAQ